jgi:hypothetical protein
MSVFTYEEFFTVFVFILLEIIFIIQQKYVCVRGVYEMFRFRKYNLINYSSTLRAFVACKKGETYLPTVT